MLRISLRRALVVATGLALVIAAAPGASAEPVQDVDTIGLPPPGGFSSWAVAGDNGGFLIETAMTFTVGRAGQLTRFDLFLARYDLTTDDLHIDLRPVVGGTVADDSAALVTFTVHAAQVTTSDQIFTFDLSSAGVFVEPGEMLAVVLETPNRFYYWGANANNPYAGGGRHMRVNGGSWSGPDSLDCYVKTFVDPDAVPPAGDLEDIVDAIEDEGLSEPATRSLMAHVESAIAAFERGNLDGACGALGAALNHLEARRGKSIPEDSAARIVAFIEAVSDGLCVP